MYHIHEKKKFPNLISLQRRATGRDEGYAIERTDKQEKTEGGRQLEKELCQPDRLFEGHLTEAYRVERGQWLNSPLFAFHGSPEQTSHGQRQTQRDAATERRHFKDSQQGHQRGMRRRGRGEEWTEWTTGTGGMTDMKTMKET